MGVREAAPTIDGPAMRARLRRSDWRPWTEALAVVAVTRLVFWLVSYLASWFLSLSEGRPSEGFFEMWSHWDARLLLNVAEFGYTDPQGEPNATAFFPLFPLSVAALTALGIPSVPSGFVISFVASVVASAFLHRLVEEEVGIGSGRRAVMYLALFPTAVFLIAPYTEALFLAGAIPAFYYARRGRWGYVALPAAVAMGARFAGVFVLIGLAVEFLRRRDFSWGQVRRAAGALAFGALPLVAYCLYLRAVKGDPFYFVTDQRLGWGREFVGPVESFLRTWDTRTGGDYPTNFLMAMRMEILAAGIALELVLWAAIKREWGYAAYMGGLLAVLVTSSWYMSIPRMVLTMFPAVIFLSSFTRPDLRRHEAVLLALGPTAALGVIVFTRGLWFY